MMSVTLDTFASDFNPAMAAQTQTPAVGQRRSLLLAPPSIALHEEKLRDLFTTFERSTTDLQMLDRLSAGLVTLPGDKYDQVLVLTDVDGSRRAEALQLLNRGVFSTLVPAMKAGAILKFQDGRADGKDGNEAILAGLVEKDGGFEKPAYEAVAVPLKLGGRKKQQELGQKRTIVTATRQDTTTGNDDDELIDEDTLLNEEDMTRPLQLRQYLLLRAS